MTIDEQVKFWEFQVAYHKDSVERSLLQQRAAEVALVAARQEQKAEQYQAGLAVVAK